jgi:phosphinothricin acetyltransferase
MPVLLERARAGEMHAIVAGIESTNAISIALHEKHGFRRVAHLPQVGLKFGRWLDLDYLQLSFEGDPVTE